MLERGKGRMFLKPPRREGMHLGLPGQGRMTEGGNERNLTTKERHESSIVRHEI